MKFFYFIADLHRPFLFESENPTEYEVSWFLLNTDSYSVPSLSPSLQWRQWWLVKFSIHSLLWNLKRLPSPAQLSPQTLDFVNRIFIFIIIIKILSPFRTLNKRQTQMSCRIPEWVLWKVILKLFSSVNVNISLLINLYLFPAKQITPETVRLFIETTL